MIKGNGCAILCDCVRSCAILRQAAQSDGAARSEMAQQRRRLAIVAEAYAALREKTKRQLDGLKVRNVYQSKHSERRLMSLPRSGLTLKDETPV